MAIEYPIYCSKVCGGKCCKVWDREGDEVCSCPNLTEEKTCSIYKERFEEGRPFQTTQIVQHKGRLRIVNLNCGLIKEIIAKGALDKHIEDECCFAHPELLERYDYDSELDVVTSKRREVRQYPKRVSRGNKKDYGRKRKAKSTA